MRIEVHRKIKIPEGWFTAEEVEEKAVPGDIIEIKFGNRPSHFLLNVRKGWCVHVRPLQSGSGDNDDCLKDATDLQSEAGFRPCRINNFEEFAESNKLKARSLKDCLNICRAGLANGPTTIPIDIPFLFDDDNVAQEFCLYWKYSTQPSQKFQLFTLPYMMFVIIAAACVAILLAFL